MTLMMATDKKVTLHLRAVPHPSAPVTALDTRVLTILGNGSKFVVGRSSKNSTKKLLPQRENAFFECPVMSRHHAVISAPSGAHGPIVIQDTNSMHGVYLNSKKITAHEVKRGDLIRFGGPVTRTDAVHDGLEFRVDDIVRELDLPPRNTNAFAPSSSQKHAQRSIWPSTSTAKVEKKDILDNVPSLKTEIKIFDENHHDDLDPDKLYPVSNIRAAYHDSDSDDACSDVSNDDSVEYGQDVGRSDLDQDDDDEEVDFADEVDYDDEDDDTRSHGDLSSTCSQEANSDDDSEDFDDIEDAENDMESSKAFNDMLDEAASKIPDQERPESPELGEQPSNLANFETDKVTDQPPLHAHSSHTIDTSHPTFPMATFGNAPSSVTASALSVPPNLWSNLAPLDVVAHQTDSYPEATFKHLMSTWKRTDDLAVSSMTLPPSLPSFESEYDHDESVCSKNDSPVPRSPAPVRQKHVEEEPADVSADVVGESLSSASQSVPFITEVGSPSKTGEKRKRDVEDAGTQDSMDNIQPVVDRPCRTVHFLKDGADSVVRPTKRVKRHEARKVAFGAVVGALGGVVAGIGFLMTPLSEQLLASWPV